VIRVGTRASALARAQADVVAEALRARGARVEVVPMQTEGDRRLGARLADVGGKGLFVREIEEALLGGAIDVAVHSLKDLPADLPPGLALAAFPEREDPRDVLVTPAGGDFGALPRGACLGTSSPRRRALALAVRDDLRVEPVRGNVDTRLRKLAAGECDALMLAAAGLRRLGLAPPGASALPPDVFVPAVGQGILGVEVRADDRRIGDLVRDLDHAPTRAAALAERAYLRRLGASCNTAVAAHAMVEGAGTTIRMDAIVASEDGRRVLRDGASGVVEEAEDVGIWLAESILAQGAAAVTALEPARWR
jgi:hydroxymethylbilane synthase